MNAANRFNQLELAGGGGKLIPFLQQNSGGQVRLGSFGIELGGLRISGERLLRIAPF